MTHASNADDRVVRTSSFAQDGYHPRTPRAESLAGSVLDYAKPPGADLLARTEPFEAWRKSRLDDGVWPFSRVLHAAPKTVTRIVDQAGRGGQGENFASQDYLGLASHPAISNAVQEALAEFGPHSAGSPAFSGNTTISQALETEIAAALRMEHVLLCSSGWGAGYGAIAGLVRGDDWIVMDQLAHSCLINGANGATRNIRRFKHNDVANATDLLTQIRARDTDHAILVITESLFSMDSDVPDLRALQEACRANNATLLVDVAHDFGALGPNGCGAIETQGLLGEVDLVIGAFSKTFAANGGFIATRRASVREYLRLMAGSHTFSNAISPLQTAAVLAALRIVRSPEGAELRRRLARNATALRADLDARGVRCLGEASAVVPAIIGAEGPARITSSLLTDRGVFVGLAEYPGVPLGTARLRLQVSAAHTEDQITRVGTAVADAIAEAAELYASAPKPKSASRARLSGAAPEFATSNLAIAGLSPRDAAHLAAATRAITFADQSVILREGDRSPGIMFIQSGAVHVTTEYMGAPVELAILGPGDVLGEVSALDGGGASASAVAAGEVKLVRLDDTALGELARSEPALAFRFMRAVSAMLAGRLRGMNTAVAEALAGRGGD